MITPSSIYWLTRCDAIRDLTVGLFLIFILLGVVGLIGFIVSVSSEGDVANPFGRRFYKTVVALIIATMLGKAFLPTTKEMAAIIVIPRIANSESVQQLGEGIVTLAQDWLKELSPKKGETK